MGVREEAGGCSAGLCALGCRAMAGKEERNE